MTDRIDEEVKAKTYDQLSQEFRTTYGRACDLIPAMYKRLISVDELTHKDALAKIYSDHKDLLGFSYRNIQRFLPIDSPTVPRRVVSQRRKNSITKSKTLEKLSDSELLIDRDTRHTSTEINRIDREGCIELKKKNGELEEAVVANTKFLPADTNSKFKSDKEFRLPLKIIDIKKYLIQNRNVGHISKIWVIVKVDIERGIVNSTIIDGLEYDNSG